MFPFSLNPVSFIHSFTISLINVADIYYLPTAKALNYQGGQALQRNIISYYVKSYGWPLQTQMIKELSSLNVNS
jgi:hypothetical protein